MPELVPVDPRQAAICDSIYFAAEELADVNPIVNVRRGEDFDQAKKYFLDNVLPRRLENLKKFMINSGVRSQWAPNRTMPI